MEHIKTAATRQGSGLSPPAQGIPPAGQDIEDVDITFGPIIQGAAGEMRTERPPDRIGMMDGYLTIGFADRTGIGVVSDGRFALRP